MSVYYDSQTGGKTYTRVNKTTYAITTKYGDTIRIDSNYDDIKNFLYWVINNSPTGYIYTKYTAIKVNDIIKVVRYNT